MPTPRHACVCGTRKGSQPSWSPLVLLRRSACLAERTSHRRPSISNGFAAAAVEYESPRRRSREWMLVGKGGGREGGRAGAWRSRHREGGTVVVACGGSRPWAHPSTPRIGKSDAERRRCSRTEAFRRTNTSASMSTGAADHEAGMSHHLRAPVAPEPTQPKALRPTQDINPRCTSPPPILSPLLPIPVRDHSMARRQPTSTVEQRRRMSPRRLSHAP